MKVARLGLWLRWSLRDLRGRWALVLAIGLVIAIGTGVNAGLGSMKSWRIASNDASYAALRAHDVELQLTEGTSTRPGSLAALATAIPSSRQVALAQERLRLPTQVEVPRPGAEPLLTPGEVVGAPLGPRGPRIDGIYAAAGRALGPGDEGRPVAVLERGFAEHHDLPPGGRLRLAGGTGVRYVGVGGTPEYFLVTRPGGGNFGGAEAQFAAVFTSLRTAQALAGPRPVVNDLVLRLKSGGSPAVVRRQLGRSLRSAGLTGEVTTLAQEPAHRVLYKDAAGDQEMFDIFGFLILAGAALAAFNLATRIVEAQRREIGIGMALGVPPRELAIRPLLLGLQIAVVGTVLGLLLGIAMGDIFRGVLEDLLPLPVLRTPFELAVFLRAAALGLVLPLLATAIPVWRGLRQTPVQAIRVGFRSARGSGLAGLGRHLRLPGSSVAQMPLRNVMRAPRRTLLTVVGIGAVLSVLVSFLGMIDSFGATVDSSEAEVAKGNPHRITVGLSGFETDRRALAATAVAGVRRAEPRLVLPVKLSSREDPGFEGSLTLLDFKSRIWAPTIVAGDPPAPGTPGVVVSEKAAGDLGVSVGDPIEVEFPRPTKNGFVERKARALVSGLDPDPFRTFAYMDRSVAAAAGFGGVANQVAITPRPGFSENRIARALFRSDLVASVEEATATTKFVRERIDDFVGVLRLVEGFALALALLIAFNSSSIGIDERRRENATMLAFGVTAGRAMRLAVLESVITGALGTLLGLAGGYLLVRYLVTSSLAETLPDLGIVVHIAAGSVVAAAGVALLAVALAPLLSFRKIERMDIPSTLRVVE